MIMRCKSKLSHVVYVACSKIIQRLMEPNLLKFSSG